MGSVDEEKTITRTANPNEEVYEEEMSSPDSRTFFEMC